jgi:ribose transport system ATP-binding protein
VALAVEGLSKTFDGQRALDAVDLEIGEGEVHALLGQNGSGKSTLIKILSGYHQPDPGASATVSGESLTLGSAEAAHRAGLRFIHQDLALVDAQDVVDNLALGGSYRGRFWLSDRVERGAARDLLAEYGIEIEVDAPLAALSPARRAMVAILRALGGGAGTGRLFILDEPTVSLSSADVELLFSLIRELRRRGATIIYVTHRLSEIFEIADKVSVLRDGRRVATRPVSELDHDQLAELIVGRPLSAFYPELPPPRSELALSVRGLRGGHLEEFSVDLHRSEIVGLAGLLGSGYEEVLPAIFGAVPAKAGEVETASGQVAPLTPANAIAAGIAFAPADRKRFGALMSWSLRENVTLPALSSRGPARWLGVRREAAEAKPWLERLQVVPSSPEASFASLSGGNQQKVVLARWLRCGASVLLLDEPTNGVDVGAKHALYEALATAAADGTALLIASGDAEELCAVCDRVLVFRGGRVVAELGTGATVDQVLAASLDTDNRLSEVRESA